MSFSSSLSDYWRALEFASVSDHCFASISSSTFCCFPFLHMWPFSRAEYTDVDAPEPSQSSWAPPSTLSSSSYHSTPSSSSSAALNAPVAAPVFSSHLASSTFSSPERLTRSLAVSDRERERRKGATADLYGAADESLAFSPADTPAPAHQSKVKKAAAKKKVRIADDRRQEKGSRSSKSDKGKAEESKRGVPPMSSSPPSSSPTRLPLSSAASSAVSAHGSSSSQHRDEDVSDSEPSSDSSDDEFHSVLQHERALPSPPKSGGKAHKKESRSSNGAR